MDNQDQCGREMPRYQSHKQVWALKIAQIGRGVDGSAILTPQEEGYGSVPVTAEYFNKHEPYVGGYYVVYADGYASFSPPEPFERGYLPMRPTGPMAFGQSHKP